MKTAEVSSCRSYFNCSPSYYRDWYLLLLSLIEIHWQGDARRRTTTSSFKYLTLTTEYILSNFSHSPDKFTVLPLQLELLPLKDNLVLSRYVALSTSSIFQSRPILFHSLPPERCTRFLQFTRFFLLGFIFRVTFFDE